MKRKASDCTEMQSDENLLLKRRMLTSDVFKRKIQTPPLHLAVKDGDTQSLEKILIELSEYPDELLKEVDMQNCTTQECLRPLHIAAKNGNIEVVDILIKYGADIDARDRHKLTALMHALKNHHIDTVLHLLGYGANPTLTDNNKKNVLDRCRIYHQDCCYQHVYPALEKSIAQWYQQHFNEPAHIHFDKSAHQPVDQVVQSLAQLTLDSIPHTQAAQPAQATLDTCTKRTVI